MIEPKNRRQQWLAQFVTTKHRVPSETAEALSVQWLAAEKAFLQYFVKQQLEQSSLTSFYAQLEVLLDQYVQHMPAPPVNPVPAPVVANASEGQQTAASPEPEAKPASDTLLEIGDSSATTEEPPDWADAFADDSEPSVAAPVVDAFASEPPAPTAEAISDEFATETTPDEASVAEQSDTQATDPVSETITAPQASDDLVTEPVSTDSVTEDEEDTESESDWDLAFEETEEPKTRVTQCNGYWITDTPPTALR